MSWPGLIVTLTLRAVLNPRLALALLRVAWRFRSRGSILPIPDHAYLAWRMYTAYGDADAVPPARDIEHYALWATSKID
jgi:hypothetical protein